MVCLRYDRPAYVHTGYVLKALTLLRIAGDGAFSCGRVPQTGPSPGPTQQLSNNFPTERRGGVGFGSWRLGFHISQEATARVSYV